MYTVAFPPIKKTQGVMCATIGQILYDNTTLLLQGDQFNPMIPAPCSMQDVLPILVRLKACANKWSTNLKPKLGAPSQEFTQGLLQNGCAFRPGEAVSWDNLFGVLYLSWKRTGKQPSGPETPSQTPLGWESPPF